MLGRLLRSKCLWVSGRMRSGKCLRGSWRRKLVYGRRRRLGGGVLLSMPTLHVGVIAGERGWCRGLRDWCYCWRKGLKGGVLDGSWRDLTDGTWTKLAGIGRISTRFFLRGGFRCRSGRNLEARTGLGKARIGLGDARIGLGEARIGLREVRIGLRGVGVVGSGRRLWCGTLMVKCRHSRGGRRRSLGVLRSPLLLWILSKRSVSIT